jgi:hypothetical protein
MASDVPMTRGALTAAGYLACVLGIPGCGGGSGGSAPPPPRPATLLSIALSPLSKTLAAGATQQLTVTGTYSDGSSKTLTTGETFASDNTAIASVTLTSGLVTAGYTPGSAHITATDTGSGKATSSATSTLIIMHSSIAQVQVVGQPVKVFDHTTDKQEANNIPDALITAWKEANGTVNLMIPHIEAYRMRGPDLLHLTIDPAKIYSSSTSAEQIPEDSYNYHHWLMGPYSTDGVHFYSLAHSEWYACLLNGDCSLPAPGSGSAQTNSWANTLTSFVSADGGASWHLNEVNSNHAVANVSFHWTGSSALAQKIYLQALNHTGMFEPSRFVQQGSYWYAVGSYLHRDFSKIDPANGVYEAPVDKTGFVLMRTSDFTDPNGWQAWSGGSTYEPISNQNFRAFFPQQAGATLNASSPQLAYDTTAQVYVAIHTLYGGSNAVYYMTTSSLANPAWSDSTPILGTAQAISDPGGPLQSGGGTYGPVQGFNDGNYPSILDARSAGYNFEFVSGGGSPYLLYSTHPAEYGGDNLARDVYRLQLSITYR